MLLEQHWKHVYRMGVEMNPISTPKRKVIFTINPLVNFNNGF